MINLDTKILKHIFIKTNYGGGRGRVFNQFIRTLKTGNICIFKISEIIPSMFRDKL